MSLKVAINGFGRIGRSILRALNESGRNDIRVVAVNDLWPTRVCAHLLRFDSVHGRFAGTVTEGEDWIDIGKGPIRVTAISNPADLPHSLLEVDLVMECTGHFTTMEKASGHLTAGAGKVLVSAPVSEADCTVVFGVNQHEIKPDDKIVSNASCTTNCLAVVAQVLNESVGIVNGFATTVHSYTGNQPVLDTYHKNLYRARAAGLSMIPTTTGAAKAIRLVLPELGSKIDCVAIRVPTPHVSLVDFKFLAERQTCPSEINDIIRKAASGKMRDVMSYTDQANVSCDFRHDPHSAIFHLDQTAVVGGTLVRVLAWYDNECGFANRMLDVAAVMK